jgi:outer membrane protein OmpA-like peptidoglycan-associated protein
MVFGGSPALAQRQAAEPSVQGYLCTFAGKCEGVAEADVPTRVAPATKGFRIARPSASASADAPTKYPSRPHGRDYRRSAPEAAVVGRSARAYSAASSSTVRVPEGTRADLMIGFELNSARLTGDGMAKARIFAQSLLMPELRGKRFLIEGHTDSRGAMPLNMELSRRRADAVAAYLSSQGVGRDRVEVRGFGPTMPLPGHSNNDPRNRRVEAKLLS